MSDVVIPQHHRARVKQRLKVLEYVEANGVKPAARHFALSRVTVRQWRNRYRADGIWGLLPRYPSRRRRGVAPEIIPLVHAARLENRFGADRTPIWLQRVHGISVGAQTIQRLFRDLGASIDCPVGGNAGPSKCGYLRRSSRGIPFQVDVKFVRVNRQRYFQYTAPDDCTRFRVLCLYRHLNHRSSLPSCGSCARRCRFPSARSKATTAPNCRSSSRSPCKPRAFDIGTSRRAGRSRTGKSSEAIASTPRSSGSGTRLRRSTTRPLRSNHGSDTITINAFRWPYVVIR